MLTSIDRVSHYAYFALIAVLPLHTVFVRAQVAWKPWIALLILVAVLDWFVGGGFPWPRRAAMGVLIFLTATLVSWPGLRSTGRFWTLWLALCLGGVLLLVVGRRKSLFDQTLKVIFWSGAAMGVTAFLIAMVTIGVFGDGLSDVLNDLPLIDRLNKPAYLSSGFIALTNWHQDPGYAALWANVWFVLGAFAWVRGVVRAPSWVGPAVLGGLALTTLLTYSRTGWLGLIVGSAALLVAHWRAKGLEVAIAAKLLGLAFVVATLLLSILIAIDPRGVGGDIVTALEFRISYLAELGIIDTGDVGVVDPDLVVPDVRTEVWARYWHRFLDSPVRGTGLGSGWAETGLQEPHNMWLELLAETGLIGLLGFSTLIASLWSRTRPEVVVAGVVVLLAALTQTVLFEPVLWLVLGLWVASAPVKSFSEGSLIEVE
ncbi:MAG: O-antigen ligase family protein [Acidimicrobiia bacterium]